MTQAFALIKRTALDAERPRVLSIRAERHDPLIVRDRLHQLGRARDAAAGLLRVLSDRTRDSRVKVLC